MHALCKDKLPNDNNHCHYYPFVAHSEVKGNFEEELTVLTLIIKEELDSPHKNDNDNRSQRMYLQS